jgi:hypothetical protein
MKTKQVILIAFATLLLFGCNPIKEIQYIDRVHETIKTDSIYKYEKDTMTIKVKGDSTFITKWSTKIDYKFKYINKTDTVTKTKVLTKTITEIKEKKVTAWVGRIDWVLIGAALLYGIYRLLKLLKIIP